MESLVRRMVDGRDRLLRWYFRFTTPSASGLPNWRVVTWFPVVAVVGVAALVLLHWSGTSSGMHWYLLGTGDDPRLVVGSPRAIRSDEWLVQQSWVVSQHNTGFGATNPTFPGGSDMTLLNELPSWHWSSVFRPHLWGYLFFGLDAGIAWHWWVPALALVSGCYLFVVTMLPRRPLTAAFFAVAIFFTPFLQWWYTPSSVWPVAWTCLALAGIIWTLIDKRLWVRVTWAVLIGYFATTMAMGLYVPFIIPGLYVVLAFGVGYALRVRPWKETGVRSFVRRLWPLAASAIAAVTVTILFVLSRWPAAQAIQSTVYPGHRAFLTGQLLSRDTFLTGIGGAPWEQALRSQGSSILGPNSSEGSSVILLCLFLLPGLIWIATRSWGRGKRPDWLVLCNLATLLLFLAYLLIPGWNSVAHLLQLDRVSPERFRIAFVVLVPLFAVLVIDHVDRHVTSRHWTPALLSASFTVAIMAAFYWVIKQNDPSVLQAASMWAVTVSLIVAATLLLFLRRTVPIAAALLMLASVTISIGVNPVYRGIFDLSTTQIGRDIVATDTLDDGMWLGIGSYENQALLTETGVGSYAGVQNYPSTEMWSAIDPEARYEGLWNRLAHIRWTIGEGEPVVTSPRVDVVSVTFDACSTFAQENIGYVLSDEGRIDSPCLTELERVAQGLLTFRIYKVVPAP